MGVAKVGDNMIEITDHNFETEVLTADLPTLVDFYGPTCAPCKAIEPMLERLAVAHKDTLKVVKVNVNQCPQTALRYAIHSLPNLILFKNGKFFDQLHGWPTLDAMMKFIARVL
jgi:thioredoxin 1